MGRKIQSWIASVEAHSTIGALRLERPVTAGRKPITPRSPDAVVSRAEALLLRAQAIHPRVAMIAFNLACYASVSGRFEEAKVRLGQAVQLEEDVRELGSMMKISGRCGIWIGDG
jgi:hypothetical protein